MSKFLICLLFILTLSIGAQNKYELTKIDFSGNKEISTSTLKGIIQSKETPWWFWKFLNSFTSLGAPASYFEPSNIRRDLRSLKDYYNANGFFKVQFSSSYDIDSSADEAVIHYNIAEGDPARYNVFRFKGVDEVPDYIKQDFISEIDEDTNKIFSQELMTLNFINGETVLQNNGYMKAIFDTTVIYVDTTVNKVDLDVFYTPGRRYKIDTMDVQLKGEGAPYVDPDMLARITDIKRNDYYNAEKLKTAQNRLFRTGIFNSVNVVAIEQDTVGNYVPLKLEGSIGKMHELSPEVIVNNQQNALNVGLGATYTKKNFLGDARKFTLQSSFGVQDIFKVQYGQLFKKFSFRDTTLLGYVDTRAIIEQPYLFSKLIFGTWENYATINKQEKYNNTIYGSKLTLDFELPPFTFINKLSSFYNVEVSNEVYRTRNDSLSSKLISVIGLDLGKTTTDNLLFPTHGYIITLQMEEANSVPYAISKIVHSTYSGSLFYKGLLNGSIYSTVFNKKNIIIAAKLKTGHLQAYRGNYSGIPINRTFFAGGSNSVRGWRSNELIPKESPFIVDTIINRENVKGGTFLLEGSVELRIKFLENFGFAIFNDFGNTWIGYKNFRYDQLAVATGFGFRYYTSVAPFRVDFGFKTYDPNDKKTILQKAVWKNFEFHFGIGEAF